MGDTLLRTLRETAADTALVLHPAWSLAAEQRLDARHHRTAAGRHYAYRWGTQAAYRVPLAYVSPDARALLHDWWRTGERLLFTLDNSAERSHAVCRVAGDLSPLALRVRGLPTHWAGLLALEALDGRVRLGLPFILDHPQQGRLDRPQLSLL